MPKFAAFLRGINVGNIRIKMPDLKQAFEDLKFSNVITFLQTGNVVFETLETIENIKIKLETKLTKTFHYQAFVQIYDFEVLTPIIKNCPFPYSENHHNYIIFIDNTLIFNELLALANTIPEETENIKAGQNVIYWKVPKGESLGTPFAKLTAKAKYKINTTVRNINTLQKMIE